jgi:hypothetical protein
MMYYVGKTPTSQLGFGTVNWTLQTIPIVTVTTVVNHIVCAELSLLFHTGETVLQLLELFSLL